MDDASNWNVFLNKMCSFLTLLYELCCNDFAYVEIFDIQMKDTDLQPIYRVKILRKIEKSFSYMKLNLMDRIELLKSACKNIGAFLIHMKSCLYVMCRAPQYSKVHTGICTRSNMYYVGRCKLNKPWLPSYFLFLRHFPVYILEQSAPRYSLSLVHLIPFWQVWAEMKNTVQQPINKFESVQ